MLEMIVLFIMLVLFVSGFFSPLTNAMQSLCKPDSSEKDSPEPVAIKANQSAHGETVNFLSHLQNQIETELFPRPTCSVLQRHYDALVAAELENRLALMAE